MVLGAGWALVGRAGAARSAQAGRWACRRDAGRAGGALGARARGRARESEGPRARGRAGARARGRAGARARGWQARGLALGSALGALSPFSIRFDSFFFPESLNEHCSL